MNIVPYKPGYVKVTAAGWVRDKRNGAIYSTVICREKDVKYFESVAD